MKLKLERVTGFPAGFTTCGYWMWSEPRNRGTLTIQVHKMKDWRHELAVWGHEIIEATWCKVFRITTEECDKFDQQYEDWYSDGTVAKSEEPGCDKRCPYHWGHMLGIGWEYFITLVTLAPWWKYEAECNQIMGI